MKGYVARKGNRWYAVIYDGLDPVTGQERRSWHPAGTDRAQAEQFARQLAATANGRDELIDPANPHLIARTRSRTHVL
jgi:hypothetical protein